MVPSIREHYTSEPQYFQQLFQQIGNIGALSGDYQYGLSAYLKDKAGTATDGYLTTQQFVDAMDAFNHMVTIQEGVSAATGLGVVRSVSSAWAKDLLTSANQPFTDGQILTNVGRALTKHPEVVGETKITLRQSLRSDVDLNNVADDVLKNIIREGVITTPTLPRYGKVTQIQIPGGFGARWGEDGKFIGFINP